MARAAIVGGGITGLSAAYEFHRNGWQVDVHESGDRWGGKILSSLVGNELVDAGPDAILTRAEAGIGLVRELGLEDELSHPIAARPAYLFLDGKLHLLPGGTVLGVPITPNALDDTELLTQEGKDRVARDLTMAPTAVNGGTTIGELCRTRLGDELTDRVIDPLLGGINASDIDHLSVTAAAPLLATAINEHGSLIRGLAAMYPRIGSTLGAARSDQAGRSGRPGGAEARPSPPVFFSFQSGIARLVERLVEVLPAQGLHLNSPIESLDQVEADAVVVAAPTPATFRLLADAPVVGRLAEHFTYAGVSQVTVAVPGQPPLDASGILFPRVGGTVLTASTWFSSKWPHYRRDDHALIRLTSGRYGDHRSANMDDDTLVKTLLAELESAVPLVAEPTAVRVHRWPDALPQYPAWHNERVAELRQELLTTHPRLRVAGAPYDGIGIPACIAGGRHAARQLMA
ncbi:MAG: protoporphyrinogen oxidase [Acidimicrobiia bacterium]|nr:protoporphyrinogen oxidase [Acidimicrobiia bacterium]